jgi:hypothetical protein
MKIVNQNITFSRKSIIYFFGGNGTNFECETHGVASGLWGKGI